MRTETKTKNLLSVFLVCLLTATLAPKAIADDATPDKDPNMAKADAATAASAPASGAASRATATADSGSVKAQKAVTGGVDTYSRFYGIQFAFADAKGISFDENFAPYAGPRWSAPMIVDGQEHRQIMRATEVGLALEQSKRKDRGNEVITTSTKEKRAAMTVFNAAGVPQSYTVVSGLAHYTATADFCRELRTQTGSKTFKEMAKTSATCKDFFVTGGAAVETLKDTVATHQRNIERMRGSIAKDYIEAIKMPEAPPKPHFWSAQPPKPGLKPRAILSKDTDIDSIIDRVVIAHLAEACSNLWNDEPAPVTTSAPAAAGKANSGAVKK